MELIPVLDLMGGDVVRGVAGEREKYRPIESQLVDSPDPIDVALALQSAYETSQLYIADLDGLVHQRPHTSALQTLIACGLRITLDAGITTPAAACEWLKRGAANVVVPLESLTTLEDLEIWTAACPAAQLVFSIDLMNGHPIGPAGSAHSADEIGRIALQAGFSKFIVLDLAQVGTSSGVSTLPLCRRLFDQAPQATIWTGGGIRHRGDLDLVAAEDVSGVLIASALHDGRLSPDDWQAWKSAHLSSGR